MSRKIHYVRHSGLAPVAYLFYDTLEKRPKATAQFKLSVKPSGDDRAKECITLVMRSTGQLAVAT